MNLCIKDKIPFGKHKGETIKAIIENDPQYLYWACENIPQFALSTTAQEALPDKRETRGYSRAKEACGNMGGLIRRLNGGPSGEYAQLSLDSEQMFNDDREEGY